jgi:endonuclease/exonuclease/phosphatase family metal-dependent hydrolase
MGPIRILSVNINGGFDVSRRRFVLPAMRDALREVDADIVFLQEVLGQHAGHARRHPAWPTEPQHRYLAKALCPHCAYGRNAIFEGGDQGNALLSKFEIIDCRNHDASISGHEPRGLLHGVLRVPGMPSPLHVVNVHLGLREAHRRHQIALLCRLVEVQVPADAGLVVAGDFNDWRERGHAAMRAFGLHEVFEAGHGRLARTFPSRWPVLPVDRIYLRNLHATRADVLAMRPWSHLSDHAALHAEIQHTPRNRR